MQVSQIITLTITMDKTINKLRSDIEDSYLCSGENDSQ